MLARDLILQAPDEVELIAWASNDLDVTSEPAVASAVASVSPDVILNCAAYTDVDGAEANRERAFAVNGDGPGFLARALLGLPSAGRADPLLVHYSTDYVFDGTGTRPYRPADPCAPIGAYGASKLEGERQLEKVGGRYVIVRTSWLYGYHGRSFPRTMWERATKRLPTKVVNDQTGRPTYTRDLARATWQLIGVETTGRGPSRRASHTDRILQAANAGEVTWFDIARHVFQRADAAEVLAPCTTAEFPRPARRPAWSVLDTSALERYVDPLPAWDDALDRFLAELRDNARGD